MRKYEMFNAISPMVCGLVKINPPLFRRGVMTNAFSLESGFSESNISAMSYLQM